MNKMAENRYPVRFLIASEILSVAVMLSGGIVLIGWIFDIDLLKSWHLNHVSMKANTAICFLLVGAAMWFLQPKRFGKRTRLVIAGFGTLIMLLSVISLFEYILNTNLGIDELFFRDPMPSLGTTDPGRMAPNTAVCFLFAALSIVLMDVRMKKGRQAAHILVLLLGFVSFLTLIGYLYGVKAFYGFASFTVMALNTSITFFLTFIGLLFLRSGMGITALLASHRPGGIIARRFLWASLVFPAAVNFVAEYGCKVGWYGDDFASVINCFAMTNAFLWIILTTVHELNRVDHERELAETREFENEVRLRLAAIVESSEDAIIGQTLNGVIVSWNLSAEKTLGFTAAEIIGKSITVMVPSGSEGGISQYLEKVRRGEHVPAFEAIRIRKDGKPISMSLSVSPIKDRDGRVVGASVIGRDITERKKIEKDLQRTQEFNRALLENVLDGVVACNANGELMLFNRIAREWHGLDLMNIPQREWPDHYDLNRADGVTPLSPDEVPLIRAFRGETVISFSMVIRAKGREARHILASACPLFDKDGGKLGAVAVMRDVTSFLKSEEAFRASKEYLDKIINSVADPIFVKDRQHRWVLLNDSFCDFLGHAREHLIGKTDADFFPKDQVDVFYNKDEAVFTSGEENTNEECFTDAQGQTKIIVTRKTLYADKAGNQFIVGVIRDITERKRAEEELIQYRNHLEDLVKERTAQLAAEKNFSDTLIESLPGAFYLFSSEGQLVRWNKSFQSIAGYSAEELAGMNALAFIAQEDHATITMALRKVFQEGKSESEVRIETKRGQKIPYYLTGLRILIDERLYMLGVGVDITYLKKIESDLVHAKEMAEVANQAKSAFLANMSHEVRTPLNAIIGFTDVLNEETFGPLNEAQKGFLRDISQSSTHLLALVNDILDLSKIEAGKTNLELTDFNLSDFLEHCFTLVRQMILKRQIHFTSLIPDSSGYVRADERRIKQVIYNLLANAIKFTPVQGSVGVEVSRTDSEIVISVWDTGIGIEAKDYDKIFKEFVQVDMSQTRKYGGSGLGLVISKRIIELHGGKIWFESDGRGKGTRFSFTIAAVKSPPTH